MFLIKSLDDLLKVSGATLEGTVPRVAQLEADEQGVSTTWLDVAGEGAGVVEQYDESNMICSQGWYQLKTHLGRLHEGPVVYNTAFMGACSLGQRNVAMNIPRDPEWASMPILRLCDSNVAPLKWTLHLRFPGDSSMSRLWNRPRSPTTCLCHAYDF